MGTSVEDTWPSIINAISSKKVYNSGVQGYAASQFLGTLNYLQEKIYFDGIVIGHTINIYQREQNYLKMPDLATGGIEQIRVNQVHKGLVIPQILKIVGSKIKNFLSSYKQFDHTFDGRKEFLIYTLEIPDSIYKENDLKKNYNWNVLIQSYTKIAEYCKLNNKKLFLVGLHIVMKFIFHLTFKALNLRWILSIM